MDYDVIVVGAGMAGLVAATQAQELGARVMLLEKGDAPGGSLALSGGTLWCARTHDDLRRLVPRGDFELGRVLVEDFEAGVQWLQGHGATLTLIPSEPHRTVYWMAPNPRAFVAHMLERFTHNNGVLLTNRTVAPMAVAMIAPTANRLIPDMKNTAVAAAM